MAQYASFNPGALSPQPVLAWYDTSAVNYPNLPPSAQLIAVTAQQWTAHMHQPWGWTVSNGVLVAPLSFGNAT